jgi:hypothetical protein
LFEARKDRHGDYVLALTLSNAKATAVLFASAGMSYVIRYPDAALVHIAAIILWALAYLLWYTTDEETSHGEGEGANSDNHS